jgi:hypothetical protein
MKNSAMNMTQTHAVGMYPYGDLTGKSEDIAESDNEPRSAMT